MNLPPFFTPMLLELSPYLKRLASIWELERGRVWIPSVLSTFQQMRFTALWSLRIHLFQRGQPLLPTALTQLLKLLQIICVGPISAPMDYRQWYCDLQIILDRFSFRKN